VQVDLQDGTVSVDGKDGFHEWSDGEGRESTGTGGSEEVSKGLYARVFRGCLWFEILLLVENEE
jgi:hypothetical protein